MSLKEKTIFHQGYVVKSDEKGDTTPVSNDRDAIENAASQICRGLNGLIDCLAENKQVQPHAKIASFSL